MGAQEALSWLLKLQEEKPREQGAHGQHVHGRVQVGMSMGKSNAQHCPASSSRLSRPGDENSMLPSIPCL